MAVKYITRRGAIPFIREKFGVPLSKSVLDKSRMLTGQPRPDAFYGAKELFTEKTLKEFAQTLISDKPVKLINDDKPAA
jgi:hypothetical protein